ncbi:MAG: TonB-dependent receptor [Bryobacteraceae bacterium]
MYLDVLRRGGMRLLAVVFLIAVGSFARLDAQTNATILGSVTDPSGAAVAGANVAVKNVSTGVARTVTTNGQGRYNIPDLIIGDYEVQATLAGFQTVVHKGITLSVGSQSVVDFALQVGQQQQTVTVEGQVSQVETTSSAVAALVDQRQMRELPLNGRNFEQLIFLAPGVQQYNTASSTSFFGRASSYSAAGARPTGQELLLDSQDIQNYFGRGTGATNLGTSLGVEAIAEFQTLTNTYSAQFGGNGIVLNSVTKAGTNSIHGSAYEFVRNSAFDARNFFDRFVAPGQTIANLPPFRKNQFGGSLSAPIVKDKAFFFFNYEGLRQVLGESRVAIVPDANAKQGLLPCAQAPTLACVNGLANVGVSSRVASTLALWPTAPISSTGVGQVFPQGTTRGNENYFLGRFDYTLSAKDSLFARYVSDKADVVQPFGGSNIPLWPEEDFTHNHFGTIEERHIFSPAVVNLARVSLSRPNQTASTTGNTAPLDFFPGSGRQNGAVTVTGLTGIGGNTLLPFGLVQNKYSVGDDVYWTRGSHNIKMGASVMRLQSNTFMPFRAGGSWSFTSLANLLSGTANQLIGALPGKDDATRDLRETDFAFYLHDDWKLSSRLTLNVGVRYAPQTNPTERKNKLSNIVDMAKGYEPVANVFRDNPSLMNFDPRVGLAYELTKDHKTALRAGFGMFHDVIRPRSYGGGYWLAPPFAQGQQQNPQYPTPFTSVAAVVPSSTNGLEWVNSKTPYMMQYNMNIQREVMTGTILTVGYVGSRGLHMFTNLDFNPPIPQIASNGALQFASAVNNRITTFNRINPAFGVNVMRTLQASSTYNSMLVSLDRRLTKNVQGQVSYTWSNCIDDGSAAAGQENSGTSGAIMNPYNRRADRGPCSFDIRHALRVNSIAMLPFKGNILIEGWQLSGIVTASSGPPFSINTGFDQAGLQNGAQRADYVAGCDLYASSAAFPNVGTPDRWYNPGCVTLPLLGTVGNMGRNIARGPGLLNFDVALMKNTAIPKISETFNVQFRAEVFNVFNHANFGLPGAGAFSQAATVTQPGTVPLTAGQITSTTTTARQIQLGLKLIF